MIGKRHGNVTGHGGNRGPIQQAGVLLIKARKEIDSVDDEIGSSKRLSARRKDNISTAGLKVSSMVQLEDCRGVQVKSRRVVCEVAGLKMQLVRPKSTSKYKLLVLRLCLDKGRPISRNTNTEPILLRCVMVSSQESLALIQCKQSQMLAYRPSLLVEPSVMLYEALL